MTKTHKKKRKKMQKACYVDSVEKEVTARYPETLFPADDAKKNNFRSKRVKEIFPY